MNDPEKSSMTGKHEPATSNGSASDQESSAGAFDRQLDDLHDLFGTTISSANPDEEDPLAQLRNDPNYAALIRDLEYIASQARLLFAPADEAPSDEVWTKIQSQLDSNPSEK